MESSTKGRKKKETRKEKKGKEREKRLDGAPTYKKTRFAHPISEKKR